MIRALLSLMSGDARPVLRRHLLLTTLSVALRAAGVTLLVPVVAALFSEEPAAAWPWVGALTLVTVAGWAVDTAVARIAFDLGFGLLDTGQRALADRLAGVSLAWFGGEHTATARQAIAATGPELVGLVAYLVTPVLGAILLPVAISLCLLPLAWQLGVAALAGVPLLLGAYWLSTRIDRTADAAAAAANGSLTERIVEFARTQSALRAARRVEPERSHVGDALAAQHGATMRLLLRGCADRSWSSGGSGVPAVGGPGLSDESSGGDDGACQGDERVDDAGAHFGADLEFAEPARMPGVRAFHDPSGSGLEGFALLADDVVAAEGVEEVTGLV